jgi:hypothetical protein
MAVLLNRTRTYQNGTYSDNPIIAQEVNYQRRSDSRPFRAFMDISPLILIVAILLILASLQRIDYPTREFALYTIWIIHALTAVRAVSAGVNAISREHVGQTWDALVLTGISARKIFFGKWRAALRRSAPWMLALGTMRLAMLPVFTMAILNRLAWRNLVRGYYNFSSYSGATSDFYYNVEWVAWAAVVAVIATVALTMLEVLFCTALGLAASATIRRTVPAAVVALSLRFLPVALFAGFARYELGDAPLYRLARYAPFAMADAGTSPLMQLVWPLFPWRYINDLHVRALEGLLMATLLLVLGLAVSVAVAWFAIRSSGALPHEVPFEDEFEDVAIITNKGVQMHAPD